MALSFTVQFGPIFGPNRTPKTVGNQNMRPSLFSIGDLHHENSSTDQNTWWTKSHAAALVLFLRNIHKGPENGMNLILIETVGNRDQVMPDRLKFRE